MSAFFIFLICHIFRKELVKSGCFEERFRMAENKILLPRQRTPLTPINAQAPRQAVTTREKETTSELLENFPRSITPTKINKVGAYH